VTDLEVAAIREAGEAVAEAVYDETNGGVAPGSVSRSQATAYLNRRPGSPFSNSNVA
jgi:hypothetical protein